MSLRVLLDAKDLIELIERSHPLSTSDFTRWLKDRDGRVVLTFTNVSEFADCFEGVDDLLYIRSMLQELEKLPVTYLHEALIEVNELERALEAFNCGREPDDHSPYVSRWDETVRIRGEGAPGEMMVGYRLDLMVFDLMRGSNRRVFSKRRPALAQLALRAILEERVIPKDKRPKPRQALTGALERKIAHWKLTPPGDMAAFGKWIFADPKRCPGFRVAWELFWALVDNKEDKLEESDLWDNAHFAAIPYVDLITLDRRMTGYTRDVTGRLAKRYAGVDYGARAFRSLEELLATVS